MVLQLAAFNASHTGENIATLITKCLSTWSIEEKLVCIVRDNGSNFVKEMLIYPAFHIWHTYYNW